MCELKNIDGFNNYLIDKDGNIYSIILNANQFTKKYDYKNPKKLKPWIGTDNYYHVYLRKNNKSFVKLVHRLVLETFIGPCPERMQACHNDGNTLNNKLSNLRWDIVSNNMLDKIKHETINRGNKNHFSKLNEFQVRVIKKLLSFDTLTIKKISDIFNVVPTTINEIKSGRNWTYL